jgi:hypothetical protein
MCGDRIKVYVETGTFETKEITVKCGSTSPSGNPWLCDKCARIHKDRNWRKEAEEAGETWEEDL